MIKGEVERAVEKDGEGGRKMEEDKERYSEMGSVREVVS